MIADPFLAIFGLKTYYFVVAYKIS